jgi:hypothetical protein
MISDHALAKPGIQSMLHRQRTLFSAQRRPVSSLRLGAFPASICFAILGLLCPSLHAQTIDDGIMLADKTLCAGALYGHDSWDQYWEGSLERVNGNIGTVTTQSLTMAANYGVTSWFNAIINVPYVWTNASKGVLHGQAGFQDLALAAKFKAISLPLGTHGALRAIGVLYGTIPMTNYTPDLQPLSLGTNSKTISGRATLNYLDQRGLYLSNEVAMPNQFNYATSVGYRKNNLEIVGDFSQQQTRGGGDIRPQDTPFVSNRVNYSKAGATFKIPVPKLKNLQYWFLYSNTFKGRNVGQSNTITTGFMYTLSFEKRATP